MSGRTSPVPPGRSPSIRGVSGPTYTKLDATEPVSSLDSAVEEFFLANLSKTTVLPLIGASATGSVDATTSTSMFSRGIADHIPTESGGYYGSEAGVLVLGASSALNVGNGSLSVYNASKRLAEAERVGDKFGVIESKTAIAKGVAQTAGGAGFGVYRGMQAAALATGQVIAPGSTTLGTATYWMGFGSTFLFMLFFLGTTIWTAMSLYKEVVFKNKLLEKGDDQGQFDYLMKRLFADKKMQEVLKKNDEELLEKGIEVGKEHLRSMLASLQKDDPESPELKEIQEILDSGDSKQIEDYLGKVLDIQFAHIEDKTQRSEAIDDYLRKTGLGAFVKETEGFSKLFSEVSDKKLNKITRLLSPELVAKLQTLHAKGNKITPEEIAAVMQEVRDTVNSNITTYSILFVLVLFAAVVMGVGTFCVGIVSELCIAILFLVLSVGMIAYDGHCFADHIKNGRVGQKDPWLMGFSLVIATLTLATAVTLISIGTGGLVPLIFVAILGVVWIASIVTQIYVRHKILAELEKEEGKEFKPLRGRAESFDSSSTLSTSSSSSKASSVSTTLSEEDRKVLERREVIKQIFIIAAKEIVAVAKAKQQAA
ncbi:MAG: hypothetical protein HKM07_06125 [Chlamydiae bacterium]|nr:hypothetical protein [Chlamydiota bacterium]